MNILSLDLTTNLLESFSGREENDREYFPRKYGTGSGSNLRPLDLQSDSNMLPETLPTALRGPVLFLMVPWVGLQCLIVVFPDHTHLLSDIDEHNEEHVEKMKEFTKPKPDEVHLKQLNQQTFKQRREWTRKQPGENSSTFVASNQSGVYFL